MNTSRIALVAAAASLVLWAAKAIAIGAAGGHDRSALESPLFLLGFAADVTAVIALALASTRGRHVGIRLAGIATAIVGVTVVIGLIDEIIQRVQPADPSWVWVEINLWVIASLVLALAVMSARASYPDTRPSRKVSTVS